MPTVTVEAVLPDEPDDVFEWLTDPVLLARWWPTEAETDVRPGGEFRMYWAGPDVTLRGEYLVVEPGRRLEHTWSWDHDDLPPRVVTISLSTDDAGCLVTVRHDYGEQDEGDGYRDGWQYFLSRLARQLAE